MSWTSFKSYLNIKIILTDTCVSGETNIIFKMLLSIEVLKVLLCVRPCLVDLETLWTGYENTMCD